MFAIINLEMRRLVPMLPLVGILLAFSLAPLFTAEKEAVTVSYALVIMITVVIVNSIFPVSEANNRTNLLIGTLPVKRKKVVVARYLLAILLSFLCAAIAFVVMPGHSWLEKTTSAAVAMAIPLLNLVFSGPLSSRGGLEQIGPLITIMPAALVVIAIGLNPFDWTQKAIGYVIAHPQQMGYGLMIAVLTLLLISLIVSISWFQKRDL